MKTISTHELASILQINEMELDAWLTHAAIPKFGGRDVLAEVSKLAEWLSMRAIDKRTLARATVELLTIMPMARTRRQLHAAMDALLMLGGKGDLSGDSLNPAFEAGLIERENRENGLVWLSNIGEHVSQTPLPDEQPVAEIIALPLKEQTELPPAIQEVSDTAETIWHTLRAENVSSVPDTLGAFKQTLRRWNISPVFKGTPGDKNNPSRFNFEAVRKAFKSALSS